MAEPRSNRPHGGAIGQPWAVAYAPQRARGHVSTTPHHQLSLGNTKPRKMLGGTKKSRKATTSWVTYCKGVVVCHPSRFRCMSDAKARSSAHKVAGTKASFSTSNGPRTRPYRPGACLWDRRASCAKFSRRPRRDSRHSQGSMKASGDVPRRLSEFGVWLSTRCRARSAPRCQREPTP